MQAMPQIQPPNVAGLFYPGDPETLRRDVQAFLSEAKGGEPGPVPKALISPHAGYIYSGPVAASAYAQLAPARGKIERVVVLAPSHQLGFRGIALSSATQFETPLGTIPVDLQAVELASRLPAVNYLDRAFAGEHALEVQLPFLQMVLDSFKLVPLIVGEAEPLEVANVLEALWGDEETLIVISSDLCHYQDYDSAIQHDRHTTDLIEALNDELAYGDACGRNPIRGLLRAAREHGLQVSTLDLRNSGDTAGPRDRVVGYGAYVFH
jgi:AmmeMemoRadiSam system protein B